jgi:hypothetical protein
MICFYQRIGKIGGLITKKENLEAKEKTGVETGTDVKTEEDKQKAAKHIKNVKELFDPL